MAANKLTKIMVVDEDGPEDDIVPNPAGRKKGKSVKITKSKISKKTKAITQKPKENTIKVTESIVAATTELPKTEVPEEVEKTETPHKEAEKNVKPAGKAKNSDAIKMPPDKLSGKKSVVKQFVEKTLAEDEKKLTEAKAAVNAGSRRSIKLYRKIAYSFLALTVVLLAAVAYFTLVKVTIILIPNQERISNNMIFDVYDKDKNTSSSQNAIAGVVKELTVTEERVCSTSEAEIVGEEVVGQVRIINSYNKSQPLVATTRLLSADGKMYRIKNTVTVPAGGEITVDVYADQPKPEMAIAPTKFTIPGLWAGLQEQIYGQSDVAFVYQKKVKNMVTQADLDQCSQTLKDAIVAKVKTDVNETYKDYKQIIYKVDDNSTTSFLGGKLNEERDNFPATITATVIVVAFDDSQSATLARQKFISALPDNKELVSFDTSNIIYTLNNYDQVAGTATVSATFEGKVSLKANANIVELNKIVGLNDKQLTAYLNGLPDIAGFEVRYYPSFIKQVPKLVDRITIEVKK